MSNYKHERGWLDSEIWGDAPYSERESWSWMIGEAAWKNYQMNVNGHPVMMKRGQFTASLRFMANKWQWNKNKVDRYLNKLELWQMIEIETDIGTGQTIVTICNYEKYQVKKEKIGTANGTEAGQQRDKLEEILINSNKKKAPPDGDPPKLHFEGHVIRLTERDWLAWLAEFSLAEPELEKLICERDDFLKTLNESDNRRSRWWMPTRKWLAGEVENLKKSKQGGIKNAR